MSGSDVNRRPPLAGAGGRNLESRRLEDPPVPPPRITPEHEPPTDPGEREAHWTHDPAVRDTTPAVGTAGQPASWGRAQEGADVALARPEWGDAQWSYLFKGDTVYAPTLPAEGQVPEAARAARAPDEIGTVQGPMIKPAVWTWEIPVYFWTGGIAAGASFVALACDLTGDPRSARVCRAVALGALAPSPALLIMDLGRPARFLNMLRIFKPRSPMNTGAWALSLFGALGSGAVAADLLGAPRAARGLGAANAVVGGYLGSYTGVLLASTAVPLWARSRLFLGPIFVATAAATGAAACRLTLVARGLPVGHPTREALGTVEMGAMAAELGLSLVNERRLGPTGDHLEHGRAGTLFKVAKCGVYGGLALRLVRRRLGPRAHHAASFGYLAAGLCFRWAWIEAGRTSAGDHEQVARMARSEFGQNDRVRELIHRRTGSLHRPRRDARAPRGVASAYAETVRRASLLVERLVGR